MRKQLLTKMLLIAATLFMGTSAWGAGYVRTLTDALVISGYKAKAFYDFQNNSPEVLPTSGDLRYRAYGNGGYWGLHNFGGGSRSGTATIPVAKGDILVIQEYSSSYVTTINRGSENAALTASTGYRVFDISTTADDVTFTTPRYGGIVAAFVMEKDNTVKTGNYTINYKSGGTTVKTVSGTGVAVGTEIPVLSSFTESGVKYFTDGGQASSLTIAEGENNLDITVTVAAQYTCTVNAKVGKTLLASPAKTGYSGDDVKVFYKKAYTNDGVWYMTPANGSYPWYAHNFSAVSANSSYDVTTYVANPDVVYFGEVEEMNLSGTFAADGAVPDRYSNGVAKRLYSGGGATPSSGSCVYTDDIATGVYTVTLWARNQSGSQNATLPVYLRDSEGNMTDLSTSFDNWAPAEQGEKSVTVTVPDDGKTYSIAIYNFSGYNTNLEMDYLYVTKKNVTATITSSTGYATFSSTYALDFTGITTLTAYKATESYDTYVKLEPITGTVAANTGLVIYGATTDIPVVASGDEATGNLLKPCDGSWTTLSASETGTNYVLSVQGGNAVFAPIGETPATLRAGVAYLYVPNSSDSRTLNIVFGDEATGISNVKSATTADGQAFNLAGQRVAQPTKGLYIVNGKKVIIK